MSASRRASWAKSTPTPGVTVIPEIRSACWSWPAARRASSACCWVMPGGSCWPTTPSKISVVAVPRRYGPSTDSATLIVPSEITPAIVTRSGRSRRSRRLRDPEKSFDFSAGTVSPAIGPPRPGPPPPNPGPRIPAAGGRPWPPMGMLTPRPPR